MKLKAIIKVDLEGDFRSGIDAFHAANAAIEYGLDIVWERGKISGYENKIIEIEQIAPEKGEEKLVEAKVNP